MKKIKTPLTALWLMLAALVFPLISANPCHAGAWTVPENEWYDRVSFNYYYAGEEFNQDGDRSAFTADGNFRDFNLGNYLEYGITGRLTLINSLCYKYIIKEDHVRKAETYSLGDIDLALKWKAFDGEGGVLSTQALVKIPDAYDEDEPLPVGNGQYDLELRMLYGRSLYPLLPGYGNVEAAYRWRFEAPSDEIRYIVEFGADFTTALYGRIKLDGLYSMDNGKHRDESGNPTMNNNFDLGKLDLCLGYMFNRVWGLEIAYTPALYGRMTSKGTTYTAAVVFRKPAPDKK